MGVFQTSRSIINISWPCVWCNYLLAYGSTKGILKQVLTEGERYIMTVFAILSFAEQGVYDVVNNLGSMAARFLFLPIEESSYFYFAQMLNREIPIEKQTRKDIEQVAGVLSRLLRTLSLLGSIILVFGLSYSHLLLHLYGGSTLTDGSGPSLMRTHCLAVWLMVSFYFTDFFVNRKLFLIFFCYLLGN